MNTQPKESRPATRRVVLLDDLPSDAPAPIERRKRKQRRRIDTDGEDESDFKDIGGVGHIDTVALGQKFDTRLECSTRKVHPPLTAGIYGKAGLGALSVVLSGGYANVDHGEWFLYSGTGKDDDQDPDHRHNSLLVKSAKETNVSRRYPVRVIRGSEGDPNYSPKSGYRYDGLYMVTGMKHSRDGKTNKEVLQFRFDAIPGDSQWWGNANRSTQAVTLPRS